MFNLLATIPRVLFSGFQSRRQLTLENLALRHQLVVLQRCVPRPKLTGADRFLWVLLVRVAADAANRSAAHRRGLASGRIPLLLALEIALESRKAAAASRPGLPYPAHVARQSHLGQPAHPGGTG